MRELLQKNRDALTVAALAFIPVLIGMIIGFYLCLQTPKEQLTGDVNLPEVAIIDAFLYGARGYVVGMIFVVLYAIPRIISHLRAANK